MADAPIRVNAGVLQILGEQLVSDPLRALSELVKNAYDADAENAKIVIKDESITIVDDGHGMTPDDIESGWLQLGTPDKRERMVSKEKNRPLTGSKGIGRLAAFSLGDRVVLETGTEPNQWYRVELDLQQFKDDERILSDYTIPLEPINPTEGDRGTRLILSDLKWNPSEEELKELKIRLGLIRGPENESDFSVTLVHDGEEEEVLVDEELPVAPLTVIAEVNNDGVATVTIEAAEELYIGPWEDEMSWSETLPSTFNHLKGTTLKAYWYPRAERARNKRWDYPVRIDFLKEIAGVRVYRDGIRVLPYGEADWLGLESRYVARGAQTRHPRPMQLVSWVSISRQNNPELIDTANRDGLVHNEAYRELANFGQSCFALLAQVRRKLEPVVSKDGRVTDSKIDDVVSEAEEVREKVADDEGRQAMDKVIEVLKSTKDELALMSMYRDRLTTGNVVKLVLHDVGASLNTSRRIIHDAASRDCEVREHTRALTLVDDLVPRIVGGYKLLKGGAREGAYRRQSVQVDEVVGIVVSRFETAINRPLQIIVDGEPIKAKIREADIWAVLVNLLHNSITSSEFKHGKEREFPQDRKIKINFAEEHGNLRITVEDNGPGLPDKNGDWIWDQFNSTRKGGGSGLGLWIISDIVSEYGGSRSGKDSTSYPTGAKFDIILPGVVSDAS